MGIDQPTLAVNDGDTRLIYHIDECLGVISREIFEHLNLITVREDGCYQTSALFRGNGRANQPFPSGRVTRREDKSSLRTGDRQNEQKTDESRRTCRTSEAFGRERGTSCQHRLIKFHNRPVTSGCLGRGGRLPCVIANVATMG